MRVGEIGQHLQQEEEGKTNTEESRRSPNSGIDHQLATATTTRTRGRRSDQPWHRTYLRNRGNVTPAQRAALRELWPTYGVELRYGDVFDVEACFGRAEKRGAGVHTSGAGDEDDDAPLILDVGFGMGDTLLQMSR